MSTITDFRKAVNAGKKHLNKLRKMSEVPTTYTLKVPTAKGTLQDIDVDVYTKAFTVGDYRKFAAMQVDEKDQETMSQLTAAVIVGALDSDGKCIFTESDAELLDSACNATFVLRLAPSILGTSGITEEADAEVKPD